MQLTKPFDVNKHIDNNTANAGPLKEGTYRARVSEIYSQETQAGDGSMFVVELMVQNRRVRDWMLFKHPNEQAVKIAMGKFATLCKAAGHDMIEDTDTLLNAVVNVDLIVDGTYNKVKRYARARDSEALPDDDLPF